MTYKGQWDNMASSYSVQDVVSYAGAFYMLTNASGYMMGNVPVGYPAYWAKLGMTYQGPWDTYVNSYGMGDLVEYGGDIYMMTNAALYMSGTWSDAHWKKMTGSSGGGGSAGDSLLGMDITSYSWDNGSNVTIRAGSVMDSMGYGNPGTVLIQGATNKGMNVSSMRHGDITAITVGADHDGIGMGGNGGDITVRTGVGGTMGGTNGALRCIAGYAQTANGDRLGRFVFGSTDESVNQGGMASDGKTFKVGVGGAFITCGQGEGPSYEGWLRIERGASDTVLTFTNSTILVDGFEVYSGPVTATATMMFHKGFCIGVGEP
jgi:hypothetical protein